MFEMTTSGEIDIMNIYKYLIILKNIYIYIHIIYNDDIDWLYVPKNPGLS